MNANEVLAAYVNDVAVLLPRKQRNDVAFELRALLDEQLQDRADAAGHPADADMAVAMLREHGNPADVAARYRPTLTIIDPADGHSFMRALVIGLVVIWGAGLWEHLQQPLATGSDVLRTLGQWWASTVVASLWWPGMLVIGFGSSGWMRRNRPRSAHWKPRAVDRIPGSRASLVLGIVAILCGVFVLFEPRWLLDVFWGGRAAPAAYDALTYTDAFRHRQGPVLFVLLLLNVPLMLAAVVQGRWSPRLRRIEFALGAVVCAAMAWAIVDGPIFVGAASDQMAKGCMALILLLSLAGMVVKQWRSVRPRPAGSIHAGQ